MLASLRNRTAKCSKNYIIAWTNGVNYRKYSVCAYLFSSLFIYCSRLEMSHLAAVLVTAIEARLTRCQVHAAKL